MVSLALQTLVLRVLVFNHASPMSDHTESIDRLSSLHDSILTRILSFLPTIDSIRTSVLAKRYRHTWNSVRAFRFNLSSPSDVDFVDRALAHISPSEITTFGIIAEAFGLIDGDRVLVWVDYVGARNVRRLELNLSAQIKSIGALFRCQSLEFLDLGRLILCPSYIPDLSAPIFPNLRILRLQFQPLMMNVPSDWIGQFVSSCCQLEDLRLVGGFFDCFDISATKLRRLELELRASEVRINCPMLEYFCFVAEDEVLMKFQPLMKFQGDMPSLRQASIHVPITSTQSQGCWSQILQSVNNAADLHLSSCLNFKVFGDLLEDPDKHLPIFHNLTSLELHECFHYDSIKFMVCMLENSPRLSFLSIFVEPDCLCVNKRQKWTSKKLPSNILDNLMTVDITKGRRRRIINKSEFVKFLSINTKESFDITWIGRNWKSTEASASDTFFLVSGDLLEDPDKRLPTFHNMTSLELHECFHYDSVKFMVYMLENSPRLSFLSKFVGPDCMCVNKRQKWTSKKLPSNILDNVMAVDIMKG